MNVEDNELNNLLTELTDGDLTATQRNRLAELVQSSDEAKELYLDHCQLHADLAWNHGTLGSDLGAPAIESRKFSRPLTFVLLGSTIVALLFALALPSLRSWQWSRGVAVGEITALSGSPLRIAGTNTELSAGDTLRPGRYLLDSGLVECLTSFGVEMILEAPAELEVTDSNLVNLIKGSLSAYVPEKGVGFTVNTPSAEVVDFGTQFAVEVSETGGGSEVHVFDGEVEVKNRAPDATPVRLQTAEATRVAGANDEPAGISLARDRFILSLEEPELTHTALVREFGATAHFRMRPSDDGRTLIDDGEANHGIIHYRPETRKASAPGVIGASLLVGGRKGSSHAVVDELASFSPSHFTFAGFVRADSRPRGATIAQFGNTFSLELHQDTGRVSLEILDTSEKRVLRLVDPSIFSLTDWHHIAFTISGEEAILYHDGKEVARGRFDSEDLIEASSQSRLSLGAESRKRHPRRGWDGRIDEVAIFDRALSPDQISQLYGSNQ